MSGFEVAAIAMMAAGTAVQFAGARQQGKAAQAAANYNAEISDQNAEQVRQQTEQEVRQQRVMASKELGLMRANYAASGISLEGSAMDVLEESAANAEMDVLNIKHQGALQQKAYRDDATFQRFSGKQANKASKFGAAGILLDGGSKSAYMAKDVKLSSGNSSNNKKKNNVYGPTSRTEV